MVYLSVTTGRRLKMFSEGARNSDGRGVGFGVGVGEGLVLKLRVKGLMFLPESET